MTQENHITGALPPAAWLGGSAEYPREIPVHRLFEAIATQNPGVTAIISFGGAITYAELDSRADAIAAQLLKHHAQPGTPVAVCLERSPELIVALLAVLKAGGCYVPLDPAYPADRLTTMAAECFAPLILTTRELAISLPALPGMQIFMDEPAPKPVQRPSVDVPATSPAYVMFTSGSTGRPKGVVIPHRAIARLVRGQDYVSLTPEETFLQLAPVSFDASTLEIWGPLLNGGRLAIAPPGALSLEQISETIRSLGVTALWLTSGLFNLMADECLEAFAPLRQLLAGGDVLSIPHVRKVLAAHPRLRLINGYGPTESTTFACCHTITTAEPPSIPIGKPIANTTVRILDDQLAPVPIGAPGELYIGGDGLALGYWNQPELTAEKFVEREGQRFYRTGDLVRWLPGGIIEFLGRQDHQVKIRGYRIELGEIEATVAEIPGVFRSIVIPIGEGADKSLAAYYAGPADPTLVRDTLRQRLPDYMVPAFFTQMDSLPLTQNGKVDRHQLPPPLHNSYFIIHNSPPPSPATKLEKTLASIWAAVLSLPDPPLNANFFDLGGTSLKLVEAHSRLVRELHRQVSVTALFQYPTIASLATFLSGETPVASTRIAAAAERARMQREVLARKQLSQKVP